MEITLKKDNLYDYNDISKRKKALALEYTKIANLKKLQAEYDSLSPITFLELFLSVFDITMDTKDFIELGKLVLGTNVVNIRRIRTGVTSVENDGLNPIAIKTYDARLVYNNNILYGVVSPIKLKELIQEREVILLEFVPWGRKSALFVKEEYDERADFTSLKDKKVDMESYSSYLNELVTLIKKRFTRNDISIYILAFVDDARSETKSLRELIDSQIRDYQAKIEDLIVKRDTEIVDLDRLNQDSMILELKKDESSK